MEEMSKNNEVTEKLKAPCFLQAFEESAS